MCSRSGAAKRRLRDVEGEDFVAELSLWSGPDELRDQILFSVSCVS
jgi:hypothetical protein